MTGRLPENFIESADRELELDGELLSYIKVKGLPKVEQLKFLGNPMTQSFFSSRVKSPLWDVYYGAWSNGFRFSILIEYHIHNGIRFDKEESRKAVCEIKYKGL